MSSLHNERSSPKLNSSTDDDEDDFLGFEDAYSSKDLISESNDKDALLCESCLKVYPLKFTNFNQEVYYFMKKKNCLADLIWRCDNCKKRSTPISNLELFELVKKLQARVEKLEAVPKPVEAPVAKPVLRKAEAKVTHQIIVTADNKENSKSFSKETFASKVKANLRTVPVKTIKMAKDGYGVIEFPDQAARDDGLSKLKADFNVQPNNRPFRHLLPKITISDIATKDYNSTDISKLKTAICEKNPILNDLISKGKVFDILFIKEDHRRNNYSIAAVAVDEEVYNAVKSMRFKIYVDFSCCRVSNRFHITQCYSCQKFGHTKSSCPDFRRNVQVCRYCTENHDGKNCSHKGDPSKYKCANCGQNHSTTYAGCSILRSQVEMLAKRTKCMDQFSKNNLRPHEIVT